MGLHPQRTPASTCAWPLARDARQTATHLDTEAGYDFKDPFDRGTIAPYAGVALAGEYRT